MKSKVTRSYDMSARAESAAQSSENILNAIRVLWIKKGVQEISLEMIAEKAGVTVRTILRKYGSKEGLIDAAIQQDAAGIEAIKSEAEVGHIEQIVSVLMKEYEYIGLTVVRTLAVESQWPLARKILKKGRASHKKWCANVFAPFLPSPKHAQYSIMLGMFYAATDVYSWKLLRKDLGYSKAETTEIFIKTLQGLSTLKNQSL